MSRDATLDDYVQPPSSNAPSPGRAKRAAPTRPAQNGALPSPPAPLPANPEPASLSGALDLRELKAEARRLLAPGHPVRVVVESQPDYLAGPEAVGRMEVIIRMILAHRRPPGVG